MDYLVQAQHTFINAQQAFLHDANVTAFLAAQRNLIAAQDEVLHNLGVYG